MSLLKERFAVNLSSKITITINLAVIHLINPCLKELMNVDFQ